MGASLASMLAVVVLALAVAWLVMAIWIKGGPQPVHRIVIVIPAPQLPATARPRA